MQDELIDRDLKHLRDFPQWKKESLLQRILLLPALRERVYSGENCYENVVAMLHAKGFELIDIEREEAAFTTMWYRKNRYWFGLLSSESVAVVVWESVDGSEQATLRRWRL